MPRRDLCLVCLFCIMLMEIRTFEKPVELIPKSPDKDAAESPQPDTFLESLQKIGIHSTAILQDEDSVFVVEFYGLLSQYFMIASPKHPLMWYAIQRCIFNLLNTEHTNKMNAAFITGPTALHEAFQQFTRDVHIPIMSAREAINKNMRFQAVVADTWTGKTGRHVRAIGNRTNSELYVKRDVLAGVKLDEYALMGLKEHNTEMKTSIANNISCLSILHDLMLSDE